MLPFGGRIRFVSPTTGWLAGNRAETAGDLLYVTFDGGLSWEPVDLGLTAMQTARQPRIMIPTLSPNGRDGIVAVVMGGQAPGETLLYMTADGGRTWQKRGDRSSWATPSFRDGLHGWVLDGGRLFRTEDGGATWQPMAISDQPELEQVSFISDQVAWGLANTGLWRTEDGGQTWARIDAWLVPGSP